MPLDAWRSAKIGFNPCRCVVHQEGFVVSETLGNTSFIGDDKMNTTRLIAIVLIVAGVLGLVYGGFSYTKDTTAVKIGPVELSVKERETVNIPMWAGIGAIVIGGLLLVLGNKKR
jgi:uncharacterized membrane protein